jgi:hypothetical protein
MRSKISISAKAKNLFLSLAESTAQTVLCWGRGGTTWETIELGKKMTNGLLSKSSSTVVLPPGQKVVLGLLHPYIYAHPHHQATGYY